MSHMYLQKKHDATTLTVTLLIKKNNNNLHETMRYPEVNKHSTKQRKHHLFK